jgi:hypothetical protein
MTDHGFAAKYASVMRYAAKLHGARPVEARVVIRTAPGEEAQVDYGEGPMVREATTGKYRRTRLAEATWHRLDGQELIPLVRVGVRFVDGKRQKRNTDDINDEGAKKVPEAVA